MLAGHPRTVLAGGWLRDAYRGINPTDIDLFGPADDCPLAGLSCQLQDGTAIYHPRDSKWPVQWVPIEESRLDSFWAEFDFTINCIALYGGQRLVTPSSLRAKRLVLTEYQEQVLTTNFTIETAAKLWKRIFKLAKKGYYPAPGTISRLVEGALGDTDFLPGEIRDKLGPSLGDLSLPEHLTQPCFADSFDPTSLPSFDRQRYWADQANQPADPTPDSYRQGFSFTNTVEAPNPDESNRPELAIDSQASPSTSRPSFPTDAPMGTTETQRPPTASDALRSLSELSELYQQEIRNYNSRRGATLDWTTSPPSSRQGHSGAEQSLLADSGLLGAVGAEQSRMETARSLRQGDSTGLQGAGRPEPPEPNDPF